MLCCYLLTLLSPTHYTSVSVLRFIRKCPVRCRVRVSPTFTHNTLRFNPQSLMFTTQSSCLLINLKVPPHTRQNGLFTTSSLLCFYSWRYYFSKTPCQSRRKKVRRNSNLDFTRFALESWKSLRGQIIIWLYIAVSGGGGFWHCYCLKR